MNIYIHSYDNPDNPSNPGNPDIYYDNPDNPLARTYIGMDPHYVFSESELNVLLNDFSLFIRFQPARLITSPTQSVTLLSTFEDPDKSLPADAFKLEIVEGNSSNNPSSNPSSNPPLWIYIYIYYIAHVIFNQMI